MAKRLLIAGDSFAAPYPNDVDTGWPNLLKGVYEVTNVAQAGVSEYKILKQLRNISGIEEIFDLVIVAHTSPYRVHTVKSIHDTELHKDCDLLLADIESFSPFTLNPAIKSAKGYFKYHFDPEYYEDIYELLREDIEDVTKNVPTLHIDHFETSLKYAKEKFNLNLSAMWPYYRGNINHYTPEGNQIVCARVLENLKELK